MKRVYSDHIPTTDSSIPSAANLRLVLKDDEHFYVRDDAGIDSPIKTPVTISNDLVGTSHTLVIEDSGVNIDSYSTSPTTISIPPNSSVPFKLNTSLYANRIGSGPVTIQADITVRLNGVLGGSTTLEVQFGQKELRQISIDNWRIFNCCCDNMIHSSSSSSSS
jgi:hypothetical protein